MQIANVTLHVGIGTFRPVKEEKVEDHEMHSEHFYIKREDVEKINNAKKNGKRIIAVGTTSCRVLETIADENGMVKETEGDTKIFIYPGYKFKCLDALITNFHLPQSTLLMLVSALAGKEYILKAYNEAVKERYRFLVLETQCLSVNLDKWDTLKCSKNDVGKRPVPKATKGGLNEASSNI